MMKTIYKISLSFLFIVGLAYFVFAQTENRENTGELIGRIVVSTNTGFTTTGGNSVLGATLLQDFIPLPRRPCTIIVNTPIFPAPLYNSNPQVVTISEAKDTTTSRNPISCNQSLNNWGAVACDASINLDAEYYLLRVDFKYYVPYFEVVYKCS